MPKTTRDQANYAEGYQAALSDIESVIENALINYVPDAFSFPDNEQIRLIMVRQWIKDNVR